jgi:hypothetical protein
MRLFYNFILGLFVFLAFFAPCSALITSAQTAPALQGEPATSAATTAQASFPATERVQTILDPKKDLTKPEEILEKAAVFNLLEKRPVKEPGIFSFIAWWVQNSIDIGIPANTVVLILMLPILATLIAFMRVIVGLPSLEMLVPIALSYVFVAVGLVTGSVILVSVVAASFISRLILKKVRIMHFPKRSLSMLLLSAMVFAALSASIQFGLSNVQDISIFPILIMTLLGDSIVSVQLHKKMREAMTVTFVTIALGFVGFVLATMPFMRDMLILYPETILLLIPINILMGRYFGLRLSELFRFRSFSSYASE